MLILPPLKFQKLVLSWFKTHGRKHLPWQKNKTPYRVWISEIMLQQTQVNTVIPYFQRFMQNFPNILSLAHASPDAVLHHWTGLGYYSRARNLHRTAQMIHENYSGKFPQSLTELENLPGIGRSTAGAILAIAFKKNAVILDGNVKRVLTRLHGITQWPNDKKILDKLWQLAEKYTPQKNVADYTQAMMDLGATVCTRSNPSCITCPLKKYCVAYEKNLQKEIPQKKPSKLLPTKQVTLLILKKNARVLLEKRPSAGIWGGLWSLPEIAGHVSLADIQKTAKLRFQANISHIILGEKFRHTFSHFHLTILPAWISIQQTPSKIMEDHQQIWYNLRKPQAIGLPQPIKKLLFI